MYFLLLQKYSSACFWSADYWLGTGAEGARQRLENIQPADVSMIKTRNNFRNDHGLARFL